MASATSTLASSPILADVRPASRTPVMAATLHSVGLPFFPPSLQISSPILRPHGRDSWKTASYCKLKTVITFGTFCKASIFFQPDAKTGHKLARNVSAMATGETPVEVATELPEIVKTVQEAWDRLEDKYAVTSLGFAILIALYGSAGIISAIDRLPLVPGLFELVGIGYTGWFAYRNLVFKPDREALITKIKSIYSDVIGSS